MNYLAHAYLSFNEPEILMGNLISDFVKGNKKFQYTNIVQMGMQLHRGIDHFTDTHPITQQAKQLFRPAYRLYAGAFVDVTYDYFLANDKQYFANEGQLLHFTQQTYELMDSYTTFFPPSFANIYPYMKTQNWLYNYQFNWGIEKSYQGLVKRATYLTDASMAIEVFDQNKLLLQSYYQQFFPSLLAYVQQWFLQNNIAIKL
jgi:acyl carrier protein phosphodiesterase